MGFRVYGAVVLVFVLGALHYRVSGAFDPFDGLWVRVSGFRVIIVTNFEVTSL